MEEFDKSQNKISEKQAKFIDEYLSSKNMTECCNKMGISRNTGYNYLKDESVKQNIESRRNDILKETSISMQKSLQRATEILIDIIEDNNTPNNIKINAINCLFNNSIKITDQVDILDKLSYIEQTLEKQE